jgi:hypothetical protein
MNRPKIELEFREFGILVRHGDKFMDGLTPDEALWTVAQILNEKPGRYLKTLAENSAWDFKYREQPLLLQARIGSPS